MQRQCGLGHWLYVSLGSRGYALETGTKQEEGDNASSGKPYPNTPVRNCAGMKAEVTMVRMYTTCCRRVVGGAEGGGGGLGPVLCCV